MSWKRYFTQVPVGTDVTGNASAMGSTVSGRAGPARTNYSSYLPDVYTGSPNRIERYGQYNTMDLDSEVNAALDILAEFTSQQNPNNSTVFRMDFKQRATNSEVQILKQYLQQWCKMNDFNKRMFKILRNVFKYGDAFFVRDPETKKWFHVDPAKVTKIIVNESTGKTPEQYIIKDINFNFKNMVATTPYQTTGNVTGGGSGYLTGGARGYVGASGHDYATSSGSRFSTGMKEIAVDSEHVVHLSLSEGLDNNFPFGNSLLEAVFKVFKQKELLEDAILIYRIQRAPERRIFYIDVGNMPSHLAMQFVERVKNEIHQRRLPSSTGGGTNMMDAAYNPLSTNEDYFFPQTAEGRGSKVDTLPGGTNLGEIDDLRYFTNKLYRGLKIPAAYLPTGPDDGANPQYNDGRVGTAYIQELRFNKYLERLQTLICDPMDTEFKRFLKARGINVDSSMFKLKFNPPQNFASYRQVEMDNSRVQVFQGLAETPYLSKRFAMERFLGMTQDEIKRNQKLWMEENGEDTTIDGGADAMRSAGVTPGGIAGDLGTADVGDVTAGELGDPADADTEAPAPDTTPGGAADTPGL